MPSEPQTPSRQERRKVNVSSCAFNANQSIQQHHAIAILQDIDFIILHIRFFIDFWIIAINRKLQYSV